MAIVTAAAYKTSRGITVTTHDARVAVAITVAEAQVREWCGRDELDGFESKARTEVYSGSGQRVLHLRDWPVASVATVELRSADSWEELTSGWRLGERGRLFREDSPGWHEETLSRWPSGSDNVRVTYTGGYSTMPATLAEACYRLIDRWFVTAGRGDLGMNSIGLGTVNLAKAGTDEYLAETLQMLAPWRRGYA
jgi:hypothetical protein